MVAGRINKIWKYKGTDFFLHNTACTQQYIEDKYELIGETENEPKDWFRNFSYLGKLYDVHQIRSLGDIKNIFAGEYTLKPIKEIEENSQIENINNAICPVCGYVDYNCWENECPDENYECPQCKSNLLLEHRFEEWYESKYNTFYQRTTLKKIHKPEEII